MNKLTVSSSPHIHSPESTQGIMLDVIIALLPATIYGIILYGVKAAIIITVSIISALICEFVWNKLLKKENSLGDLSAVVTGLLLALNVPSAMPVWMVALGSFVAIIIVKQMFGGLGHNFANPAMTARIVLMVSFPAAITSYYEPLGSVITQSTPLIDNTAFTIKELILGMHGGSIGEVNALLLLIGGIYLVLRKVISPIIPASFIGTVFLLSLVLGVNPITAIFSGGLFLGAIFMATDYVTSPTFPLGKLIFGIGCGIITVVIRLYAALPEGVSYAILLMNLIVPYINDLTKPKPFFEEVKKNA